MTSISQINVGDKAKLIAMPYGVCNSLATENPKVVDISGFSLDSDGGTTVRVKFTHENDASVVTNPELNINSTDAIPIVSYNISAPTVSWKAGSVVDFTYDGANWVITNYGAIPDGAITNNTSGGTSSGTVNAGQQIKIGAGYYSADSYYQAESYPTLSGDATTEQVLSGKTYYKDSYTKQTGTMANNGALGTTITEQNGTYTIPAGYTSGGTVTAAIASVARATTTLTSTADTANAKLTFTAGNNQSTGYVTGSDETATAAVSITASGNTMTATDGTNSISKSVDNAVLDHEIYTTSTTTYYQPVTSAGYIDAIHVTAMSIPSTATLDGITNAGTITTVTNAPTGTITALNNNATIPTLNNNDYICYLNNNDNIYYLSNYNNSTSTSGIKFIYNGKEDGTTIGSIGELHNYSGSYIKTFTNNSSSYSSTIDTGISTFTNTGDIDTLDNSGSINGGANTGYLTISKNGTSSTAVGNIKILANNYGTITITNIGDGAGSSVHADVKIDNTGATSATNACYTIVKGRLSTGTTDTTGYVFNVSQGCSFINCNLFMSGFTYVDTIDYADVAYPFFRVDSGTLYFGTAGNAGAITSAGYVGGNSTLATTAGAVLSFVVAGAVNMSVGVSSSTSGTITWSSTYFSPSDTTTGGGAVILVRRYSDPSKIDIYRSYTKNTTLSTTL